MRVSFISGEYPPMKGGVADYTRRLAHAISDKGANVSVISSQHSSNSIERIDAFPVHADIRSWSVGSWRPIVNRLKRSAADIAHIQYQTGAYGMNPAVNLLPFWLHRRFERIRVITTFHDLKEPYLFPKAGRVRHLANQLLMRHSDAVIFTTEEDMTAASSNGLVEKSAVIPIGSNVIPVNGSENRARVRERFGIAPDGIVIGHFGFVTPSKGVETLLLALLNLMEDGRPVSLLMIGGERSDTEATSARYPLQVRAMISEMGLETDVHWTGYLPPADISAAFGACDLMALPFQDGASLRHGSLMAAVCHGLPLVTTTPPKGLAEASVSVPSHPLPRLTSGDNCLLVSPDNVPALTDAINKLADSRELQDRLSKGALDLAASFSWSSIAENTMALYRHVLEQRR